MTEEDSKLFELKLTEIKVTSGSIPITWCIHKRWFEAQDINIKDCWVGIFIAAHLLDWVLSSIVYMFDSYSNVEKRRIDWEEHQRELIDCIEAPVITKIGDLPKGKRTIRLRFQGLKSLVCKPFAK